MSEIVINNLVYPVTQINGQINIGPPKDWIWKIPTESMEIFVNNIPEDVTEEELIPIFAQIGTIYQFRLMLTFSGLNRGFGYLMYTSKSDSRKALLLLQKYVVKFGTIPLRVSPSRNICKLILGKVSNNVSDTTIVDRIASMGPNCVKISVTQGKYKKFAIIEYPNHREAALSKRSILLDVGHFGSDAYLRWYNG